MDISDQLIIPGIPYYLSNGLIKEFKEDLEAKDNHTEKMNNVINELEERDYNMHIKIYKKFDELSNIFYKIHNKMKDPVIQNDYLELFGLDEVLYNIIIDIITLYNNYGEDFFYRATFKSGLKIYYEIMKFVSCFSKNVFEL